MERKTPTPATTAFLTSSSSHQKLSDRDPERADLYQVGHFTQAAFVLSRSQSRLRNAPLFFAQLTKVNSFRPSALPESRNTSPLGTIYFSTTEEPQVKLRQSFFLFFTIADFAVLPVTAKAQLLVDASGFVESPARKATWRTRIYTGNKASNYVFDTFGPYPIVGAAIWPHRRNGRYSGSLATRYGRLQEAIQVRPGVPRSARRHGTPWQRRSKKTPFITAVSAKACCRD